MLKVVLILIGVGLIVGAFVTAWMFWKLVDRIEEEKKEKKTSK